MKTRLFVTFAVLGLGTACTSTCPPQTSAPTAPAGAEARPQATEQLPTASAADLIKGGRVTGTVTTTPWRAIKNGAVVYIEDAPKQPGIGTSAAIDNHDMAFAPFITVITQGGTVMFGNTDPLAHNVFTPDGEKWDLGTIVQNGSLAKRFDSAGAYTLLCNLHQNMLAYVVVSPSSYFAKTTSDGKFAIVGVPAGTYRVTAWAPRLPPTTSTVTVAASGDTVANFKLQ